MSRPRSVRYRLANIVSVVIPLFVVVGMFLLAWLGHASSGAGMSDSNRPVGFIMLACGGALNWLIGATYFARLHVAGERLPRPVRSLRSRIRRDLARRAGADPATEAPDLPPSIGDLLGGTLAMSLVWLWMAPMLLGWLLQPGVYRPAEAAGVALMGLVVLGWSAILVRSATGRPASSPTDRPGQPRRGRRAGARSSVDSTQP